MRFSSTPPLLLAAICFVLLPTPVQAQGVITGQIDDAAGIGLRGVMVDAIRVSTLLDDRRPMTLAVVTGENGHYQLDLPPGVYSMRFRLPGFGTVVRENIDIEDGCRVAVDARLRPTELREGVTVAGTHPDAAASSMADRLPPVRRHTTKTRPDTGMQATPLVEGAPMPDAWRGSSSIERQLFSRHIKDACLGYAPMWLSHLDVVLKQRPCQVAWLRTLWKRSGA